MYLLRQFEESRSEVLHALICDDGPAEYVGKLLAQIVGIELRITRLVGKYKLSQNQPPANRISVEQGLREEGGINTDAAAVAEQVARLR
jgi:transcriptional regulator